MMKSRDILIAIVLFLSVSWGSACTLLSPGSYPYAEIYIVHTSEDTLKSAIQTFKQQNPQFVVPRVSVGSSTCDLPDELSKNEGYWFNVYFYIREDNKIYKCYTRSKDRLETTFALVGVNDGLQLGNWSDVNHELSRAENKHVKSVFEQQILGKVNNLIEESRTSK